MFLNSFLRNQISSANRERKNDITAHKNANSIIEQVGQMRAKGVEEEQLMEYVNNQTSNSGTASGKGNALSKVKVSSKDKADEEAFIAAESQQN